MTDFNERTIIIDNRSDLFKFLEAVGLMILGRRNKKLILDRESVPVPVNISEKVRYIDSGGEGIPFYTHPVRAQIRRFCSFS